MDAYGQADAFTIDSTAPRSRNVVWPKDDRVRPFLGLEVGAVVVEREGSPFERRRTIVEVKHRFIHLFHWILQTFNDRHPGHAGLWRLATPMDDPQQMLELVRRRAKGAEESAENYGATGTPLVAIANAEGSSPTDFMAYLESRSSGIRACIGTTAEKREAAAHISAAIGGSGAVLDLTALWTAMRLDMLPDLHRVLGRLIVPRSVIEELTRWRGDLAMRLGRAGGVLAAVGDGFHLIRHDDATIRRQLDEFDKMFAAAERFVHIEAAVAPDALPDEWRQFLAQDRQESFGDAIHLAMRHNALLLCEDRGYRELSRSIGVVSGAWLQAVTAYATSTGAMDGLRCADIVSRLALLRHGHISLNVDLLVAIGRAHPDRFNAVACYVGGPAAELRSHVAVVAGFAGHALRQRRPAWSKLLSYLVARLLADRPRNPDAVLAALIVLSHDPNEMVRFVRRWCENRGIRSRHAVRRSLRFLKMHRRRTQTANDT